MKLGFRKRSLKKSLSARTTGKLKRSMKRAVNPFYGKKGVGWIKNPKRAARNKLYNKTRRAGGCCMTVLFVLLFVVLFIVAVP